MRRVNLAEVTERGVFEVETTIMPSIADLPPEEVLSATPFKLKLRILKTASGYRVEGTVEGKVKLLCSRCGEAFWWSLKDTFSFKLLPLSAISGGEIKPSELDVKFSNETLLDLAELLREQVLLNLPVKPLCSETCEVPFKSEGEAGTRNESVKQHL
jgi:uncharacterized protein